MLPGFEGVLRALGFEGGWCALGFEGVLRALGFEGGWCALEL